MREMKLEELKKIELNILKYVHGICEKNGLKYSLAYGTMLGAVRHKGFIPWDDDIDIIMPRGSYVKLCEILKNDRRYKILTCENENYCYPWGKVVDTNTVLVEQFSMENIKDYGVYIDVFPMDRLGDTKLSIIRHYIKRYVYNLFRISAITGGMKNSNRHKIFFSAIDRIAKRKNARYWACKLDELSRDYGKRKGKYVQVLGGESIAPWKRKKLCSRIYLREDMEEIIDIEFENDTYKCVKNWEEFLTKNYGDYMKLPPESERVSKHDFTSWFKDE